MKKRFITVGICVALALITVISTAAAKINGAANVNEDAGVAMEAIEPNNICVWGKIKEVDSENSRVEVELGGNDEGTIILNVDKSTPIIDNVTRKAVALSDLKVGDTVYAWHSRMMTMSLPPQSNAIAIVVNIAKDATAGQLFEVESIQKTKNGYVLLNQQQDLFVTVPAGTKVKKFNSSGTVNISKIKPGSKLVVWYEIVALSYPGQTGTSDVMMLEDNYDGYVSIDNAGKITVNGAKLSTNAVDADGTRYVPLRDIARKLGFKATWNSKTSVLTLKKGNTTLVLTAKSELFTVNGDEVTTIAPFVQSKKLYVPVDTLNFLGDYKVTQPRF